MVRLIPCSYVRASSFLVAPLVRLAAVPACPAIPELKQRTFTYLLRDYSSFYLLHFVWVIVLHCVIFFSVFLLASRRRFTFSVFDNVTRHYDNLGNRRLGLWIFIVTSSFGLWVGPGLVG